MSQGTVELGATAAVVELPRSDRSLRAQSIAYGLLTTLACVVIIRRLVFIVGVWSATTASAGQFDPNFATLTPWLAFDAIHYLKILESGYPAGGVPYEIAFFPLLPLMGRALATLVEPAQGLLLLSNVATIVGFVFFYQWCRMWASARTAFWACLLLATFPGATVFSAGMTEGLFFCLTAMTLWLMQRDRLWLAAVLCAIATAVRPTGVALSVTLLAWALVRQVMLYQPDWRRCTAGQRLRAVAGALLRPAVVVRVMVLGVVANAGILAYQGFLWHRYDDPYVYFKAQRYWELDGPQNAASQPPAPPAAAPRATGPRDLAFYLNKLQTPAAWNRLMLLPLLGLTLWGLLQRNLVPRTLYLLPLAIFLLGYLPGWGARATSIVRFESAALPLFLLLAALLCTWRRMPLLVPFTLAQLALQLYYAHLFSRGFWIG